VTPFQVDELVVACANGHPLAALKRVTFKECLKHDFVGLNRGSSLLELVPRAAEREAKPLRVRVQVRSFDAMCQMIGANLGIGVLPRAACAPMLGKRGWRRFGSTSHGRSEGWWLRSRPGRR